MISTMPSRKGATNGAVSGAMVLVLICATVWLSAPVNASESFLGHLRCPFSKLWLEHGPDRAAEILGVSGHVGGESRRLLQEQEVFGSCSYTNGFTGQATCFEFRGSDWTEDQASTRCSTVRHTKKS